MNKINNKRTRLAVQFVESTLNTGNIIIKDIIEYKHMNLAYLKIEKYFKLVRHFFEILK